MPEFLTLLPPDEARSTLLKQIDSSIPRNHTISIFEAAGRITADDIEAPHPLPQFARSTVDGYAVRARDTYGASDSLPGYLNLIGEVPMGAAANQPINPGECAIIHTGGMIPVGADAVIMLEHTQIAREGELEIQKAVAIGENTIAAGEDVLPGQIILPKGSRIRPAEIGGLAALGILSIPVVDRIKVGIISSGDEIIPPAQTPLPGQIRDINSYTLASLVTQCGAQPHLYGIVPDRFETLQETVRMALSECDAVVITAGSSASTRDMTASVIDSLGNPGVLVHGINTRPGKPTILGVIEGKPVIGLPGNPVSALVNGYLFIVPVIEKMSGLREELPRPYVHAKLSVNLASQAGREDWQPVKLTTIAGEYKAEPVFGKSNLIFTLVHADGMIKIHPDANGLSAGDWVEVFLFATYP